MTSHPRRPAALALTAVLAAVALAGCIPALGEPGRTSSITLVETKVEADGWRYTSYRNTAYPCSVRGYQTFTVATKVGSSTTTTQPLWVYMKGGGVGYFNADEEPVPGESQKVEASPAKQRREFRGPLMDRVRADAAGFRMLAVSMCDHDIYGGPDIPDPNNPNTVPGGARVTVNGLYATKAAIQFVTGELPTDDFFLHGTSAGGFGTHHVAWSLQEQGLAPTGYVADSGILNQEWQRSGPCGRTEEELDAVGARLHPDIVDPDNEPHRLVSSRRLTVPVLDVFSIGDPGQCGTTPMSCPLPGGASITRGSVECLHEPMRRAIASQGEASPSLSMRLCVSPVDSPDTCATHTPTVKEGLTNTAAPWPADYTSPIMTWVQTRLGDD